MDTSMDGTSLYKNIPHDDGINCIKKILEQHVNSTPKNSSLITLLEFVLKSNNFIFNQDNYLQINGTVMGTRVAPTYANLSMDSLKQKYIYPHRNCPGIWFGFIDDIWGIFRGTEEELVSFVDYSNSFKFMVEYSKKWIMFLDVTMYQEENRIKSTLLVKPTDSHSYLDFSSCHPQIIKSSMPYSQSLRIRRNCIEWTEFIKHSAQLLSFLSLRGYPPNLTIPALHHCNNITQCEALLPKVNEKNSDDNSLFCITEFNPLNPLLENGLMTCDQFYIEVLEQECLQTKELSFVIVNLTAYKTF